MRPARSLILTLMTVVVLVMPAAAADDSTPFRVTADDVSVTVGKPGLDNTFDVQIFGPTLFVAGSGDDRHVQTPVLEAIARFRAMLQPPCDPVWMTLQFGGCAESFEIDLPAAPEQLQVVCHFEDGAARLLGRCEVEGVSTEGQAKVVLIPGVEDGTISYHVSGWYSPKE